MSPSLLPPPRWHGAAPASEPDWTGEAAALPGSNYLAFSVVGAKGAAVYVGFNPYPEPCDVTLPSPGVGKQWRRLVDTSRYWWGRGVEEGEQRGRGRGSGAPCRARCWCWW